MGRYHDYLMHLRDQRKQGRSRRPRRQPAAWTDGPLEGVVAGTGLLEVLTIRHRFSGHVLWTALLPAGTVADLWGAARMEVCVSFLRKSVPQTEGGPRGVAPPDSWRKALPAMCEYLFCETYPDGSRRQKSTLTVMAGDARGCKVVLNDREEGRSLWATGDDFEACLEALEVMLQAPDTPWKADKQAFRSNGKK